jgi:hypothetical protein
MEENNLLFCCGGVIVILGFMLFFATYPFSVLVGCVLGGVIALAMWLVDKISKNK